MNKSNHYLFSEILKRIDFLQCNLAVIFEMKKAGFSYDHILRILNLLAAYNLLDLTNERDKILKTRLDAMILSWVKEYNLIIEQLPADDLPELEKLRILI